MDTFTYVFTNNPYTVHLKVFRYSKGNRVLIGILKNTFLVERMIYLIVYQPRVPLNNNGYITPRHYKYIYSLNYSAIMSLWTRPFLEKACRYCTKHDDWRIQNELLWEIHFKNVVWTMLRCTFYCWCYAMSIYYILYMFNISNVEIKCKH